MRKMSKLHRAAMGALVAAALVAGAEQASAAVYRFPADTPWSMLPLGRAKLVEAGSALMARVKLMLANAWRFPEGGSPLIGRFPARIQPRND